MTLWQRGHKGAAQRVGSSVCAGSSGCGSSGGCQACSSAGVRSGCSRSKARTRLARTLAAGCNLGALFGGDQFGRAVVELAELADAGIIGLFGARADGEEFEVIGE